MRGVLILLGCALLRGAVVSAADDQPSRAAPVASDPANAKTVDLAEASRLQAEIRHQIFAYRAKSGSLPPAEAAAQWLAIFDRFDGLPPGALAIGMSAYSGPPSYGDVFAALPATTAWDLIANSFEKRANGHSTVRSALFGVMAATLHGDIPARKKALAALQISISREDHSRENIRQLQSQIDTLCGNLARLEGDKEVLLAVFERRLAELEASPHSGESSGTFIQVPDLVSLVGQEKSAATLRRIFAEHIESVASGAETQRLVSDLTAQNLGTLKEPRWYLICDLNDAPLYEEMAKRFPDPPGEDSRDATRQRADVAYLASLVSRHREKDAEGFFKSLPASEFDSFSNYWKALVDLLERNGQRKEAAAFICERLKADPSLWLARTFYISLCANLGEPETAIAFLRDTAARPDLSALGRYCNDQGLANALFNADRIDEGIAVLRRMIKATGISGDPQTGSKSGDLKETPQIASGSSAAGAPSGDDAAEQARERTDAWLRLAEVARLFDRPDLVNEAISGASEAITGIHESDEFHQLDRLVDLLLSQNRNAAAEALATTVHGEKGLELLAIIYERIGRPNDVMRILDKSRDWGMADISEFTDSEILETPLLIVAARALFETGRTEQARNAVQRLLALKPWYDPAYALLLEIGGPDLEAYLDTCAKNDPIEGRPLIWKAKLQLKQGRVEEAGKTARAAMAVNPSSYRTGVSGRILAYSILAEALDKAGLPKQATAKREAIEAFRLAEKADEYAYADLATRGAKCYEEALRRVPDDYCMHARLAQIYGELGDLDKAAEHSQRAIELIPESLGRLESDCGDCDYALENERNQEVAGRVLTRSAEKTPNSPQVFFFLGHLRKMQGRAAEAAGYYLRAVELNPDYFRAWSELLKISDEVPVPPGKVDAAIAAILRLDPGLRYSELSDERDFTRIDNPRVIWDGILAADRAISRRSTDPIYPLANSGKARAQLSGVPFNPLASSGISVAKAGETETDPPPALSEEKIDLAFGDTESLQFKVAINSFLGDLGELLTMLRHQVGK